MSDYPQGITPPKKPFKNGFNLEEFLPDISKEDADALGEMFDQMEAERNKTIELQPHKQTPHSDLDAHPVPASKAMKRASEWGLLLAVAIGTLIVFLTTCG